MCARLRPADYNPCWLLVGDRHALFSIDLTGGTGRWCGNWGPAGYVLENVPLCRQSAKQQRIAALVERRAADDGRAEADGLAAVLRDHEPAGGPRPPLPGACPGRPRCRPRACTPGVRHPVGDDRRRHGRRAAAGPGGRGAAVPHAAAGPDQPVDRPGARGRGGAGRPAVIARIRESDEGAVMGDWLIAGALIVFIVLVLVLLKQIERRRERGD